MAECRSACCLQLPWAGSAAPLAGSLAWPECCARPAATGKATFWGKVAASAKSPEKITSKPGSSYSGHSRREACWIDKSVPCAAGRQRTHQDQERQDSQAGGPALERSKILHQHIAPVSRGRWRADYSTLPFAGKGQGKTAKRPHAAKLHIDRITHLGLLLTVTSIRSSSARIYPVPCSAVASTA